jgi:hypothetical protein
MRGAHGSERASEKLERGSGAHRVDIPDHSFI